MNHFSSFQRFFSLRILSRGVFPLALVAGVLGLIFVSCEQETAVVQDENLVVSLAIVDDLAAESHSENTATVDVTFTGNIPDSGMNVMIAIHPAPEENDYQVLFENSPLTPVNEEGTVYHLHFTEAGTKTLTIYAHADLDQIDESLTVRLPVPEDERYSPSQDSITLTLKDIIDIGDFPSTARAMKAGETVEGAIEDAGDEDWFHFPLEQGVTYQIHLEKTDADQGASDEFFIEIYKEEEDEPIYNSDTSDDPFIYAHQAATTGHLYTKVGRSPDSTTGTYSLSVIRIPSGGDLDDFDDSIDTTGVVTEESPAFGEIQFWHYTPEDDWFRVRLEKEFIYRFDVDGAYTGHRTLSAPTLVLYDSEGTRIGSGIYNHTTGNTFFIYTPDAAADFYLGVSSRVGLGIYRLSMTRADIPDDFSGTIETIGRVEVDSNIEGNIQVPYDIDWFRVQLEAGVMYQFDLEGLDTGQGTLEDPRLLLRYAGGEIIAYDATVKGEGRNDRIFYRTDTASDFYLDVGGKGELTGTYRLSVITTDTEDDYSASADTTGVVEPGIPVVGKTEFFGDRDWFSVSLQEKIVYFIEVKSGPTETGPFEGYLRMAIHSTDGEDILLAGRRARGTLHIRRGIIEFALATNRDFYIEIQGRSGPYYQLTVTDTGRVDDFRDSFDTMGMVNIGEPATGELHYYGDEDWFRAPLEKGITYQFKLEHLSGDNPYNRGTTAPLLRLTERNIGGVGFTFGGKGISGRPAIITYTPSTSDIYLLASIHRGSSGATYRLSVEEAPIADDYSHSTETIGTVMNGGSATGKIQFKRDKDWFHVNLEAGVIYQFDLKGADTGDGTLSDPYLRVRDGESRNSLAYSEDGGTGRNSRILYSPIANGDFYLEVDFLNSILPKEGNPNPTGTYHLSMIKRTDIVDDFGTSTNTAGMVTVGNSVDGEIHFFNDEDWFRVTLTTGETYQFDLEGRSSGDVNALDKPYLILSDGEGNSLMENYNRNDGILKRSFDYTAGTNGSFYLQVQGCGPSYVKHQGWVRGLSGECQGGAYLLSVTQL